MSVFVFLNVCTRKEHKATGSLMSEAGALEDEEPEENSLYKIIQTKYVNSGGNVEFKRLKCVST